MVSATALQATDFLIAIAEPVCRPEYIHEYLITPHSLYAAVSVGLDTRTMLQVLATLSKVPLHKDVDAFIRECTENYGKVRDPLVSAACNYEAGPGRDCRGFFHVPLSKATTADGSLAQSMMLL